MARIRKSVEINAPVHRCFELWSDLDSFPGFMERVQDVEVTGDRTSHWKVEGPFGRFFEWDAEITAREEDRLIAWEAHGDVDSSGVVRFRPLAPDRTELEVDFEFRPTGGRLGELAARILQDPEEDVERDLQRFKEMAEGRAGR